MESGGGWEIVLRLMAATSALCALITIATDRTKTDSQTGFQFVMDRYALRIYHIKAVDFPSFG
jgi:hypothetical protein